MSAPTGVGQRAAMALVTALAAFGVFVGGLMTWHHDTQLYGAESEQTELIGCTESAEVNCDVVNTSAWSEMMGVPIATLAIPFYLVVAALALMALRGRQGARELLIGAGTFAIAYSGLLFYISKTELGYVCAWCIRLYITNLGIFLLAWVGPRPRMPETNLVAVTGSLFLGLTLVSAGVERLYRASLSGPGSVSVASAGAEQDKDPSGPAPALSLAVTTEDGRLSTLVVSPEDAWTGKHDSPVSVVMFGDLQCGYCKRSSAELSRLQASYGDRVLFVFKHFAMDPTCNPGMKNRKHDKACLAAKAAVCAQQQGRFWPFHDLAYKNQHELGRDALRQYAVEAGVDAGPWDACMASSDADQRVQRDGAAGQSIDIHGTPRIFINGVLYRAGTSAEAMAKAIETALGADAISAAQAAAKLRETTALPPVPADVPPTRQLTFGELRYTMDTFEAAIVDGKAVSAKHQIPALRTSWFDAKAACEAAGRRMCTEEEWVSACQGARALDDNHNGELADDMIEGTAYPHGDLHDPRRCWDGKDAATSRPVYTGELPGCVTAAGVYDLTGNVEEWAGETPEKAVLLGGAFDTSEDHARCYRRNDSFGAGYAAPRTGFRCCAN